MIRFIPRPMTTEDARNWLPTYRFHAVLGGGMIAVAGIAGAVAQGVISAITENTVPLSNAMGYAIGVIAILGSSAIERQFPHADSQSILIGQFVGTCVTWGLLGYSESPMAAFAAGSAVAAGIAGCLAVDNKERRKD